MQKLKWSQLFFAVATTLSLVGIGISLGERSVLGVIICLLGATVITGIGFMTKKRLREKGLS